jgi:hypothetical protein
MPRFELTEEEHVRFVEIGDEFWRGLGKLTADALRQVPEELRDHLLMFLQDRASLYGCPFQDHL